MDQAKCVQCKKTLPFNALATDARLEHKLYCVDCLMEHVYVCLYCKGRYLVSEHDGSTCCPKCRIEEAYVPRQQPYRAKWAGLPYDLTHEQWEETVRHFGGYCAYCQVRLYRIFEHFVPIEKGGGTTKNNCVPACTSCDRKKRHHHPDEVAHKLPEGAIERIKSYLSQF